jgi:hypothetical protein
VPFPHLTDREREILDLLARGLTNQAIASRLVVSDKTVRNHVSNVFAKLHVADRRKRWRRHATQGWGTGRCDVEGRGPGLGAGTLSAAAGAARRGPARNERS